MYAEASRRRKIDDRSWAVEPEQLQRVVERNRFPVQHIPYGKRPKKLPAVLSQDEVLRLLAAVRHPVRRLALTTAYAAGLRVSEVASLRVEDADSARMVLLIRQAKGKKDRIVPLAQKLLADAEPEGNDQLN